MAKYSVDLSINTKGYTDGIEQAKAANAQFDSTVVNTDKDLTSMKKELGQARRAVQNLALAYNKLSAAEKDSAQGKALQRQLQDAKKYAAELIDLNSDISKELKNMASDTAGWDAMKEGIGIAKDSLSALATVVGDATGSEKAFKEVLMQVAKIQTVANAAISIGNALQKQSAIMTGIRRAQSLALSKAIKAETTATAGATVAQKVFNAVAKANPYVLLATAIIAAAGAIAGFIALTKKSTDEEKKQQEELKKSKKAADEYAQAVGAEYGKLRGNYEQLRRAWNELKTDHEKNEFLKENKTKIEELTNSVHDLDGAERFFNKNTGKVIESFKFRAKAAAAAALAVKHYQQAMEIEMQRSSAASLNGMKMTVQTYNKLSDQLKAKTKANSWDKEGRITGYRFEGLTKDDEKALKDAGLMSKKSQMLADEQYALGDAFEDLGREYENSAREMNDWGGTAEKTTKRTKTTKEELQAAVGSIAALDKEISELQDKAKKGLLPKDLQDPQKFQEKIKDLTNQKEALELKWGFKKPEDQMKKLKDDLEKAKTKLRLAYDSNDQDAIKEAIEAVHAAQQAIDNEELRVKLVAEMALTDEEKTKLLKDVDDAINKSFENEHDVEWDFGGLSESAQQEAQKTVEHLNNIKSAIKAAQAIIDDPKSTEEQKARAEARKEQLQAEQEQTENTLTMLEDESNKLKAQKDLYQLSAESIGEMGNALTALGQAFGSQELQIAGLIAQTIAQLLQGYAAASAQAASMGPWVWLGFVASGLATVAGVIAQVKQMASNAGSYADGGVVPERGIIPGSSYAGDHLTANVNSGEMILNKRQQRTLFDIANGAENLPQNRTTVIVEGKIRGKDLLLVQKNFNTIGAKSGQSIYI